MAAGQARKASQQLDNRSKGVLLASRRGGQVGNMKPASGSPPVMKQPVKFLARRKSLHRLSKSDRMSPTASGKPAATHTQEYSIMSTNASTTVRKPANRKFGSQRGNKRSQVVRMRTKDQMSWVAIGEELDIAPRTARRLFQEKVGAHTHHGLLPGKGGRLPQHSHSEDITALWAN